MWHAFDVMTADLSLDPAVRALRPQAGQRRVYGERIVRWFADKTGDGQWPGNPDHRPGMSLTQPVVEPGEPRRLHVTHTRIQGAPVELTLELDYREDDWRTPLRWTARETIGGGRQRSPLADTVEEGRVEGGRLTAEVRGQQKTMPRSHPAEQPASWYSLIADLPVKAIDAGRLKATPCDAWLTEGMIHLEGATVAAGVEGDAADHRLAAGLRGYTLRPSQGMPLEFWVNEQGLVVYVFEGPLRALVLQQVENI
jgi:hypothetical protein